MDPSPATPLRIGAWCVNPLSGQMSRAGETVRVEARTMRLLLCLAARAGEVVSIDELLNQVWAGVIVTPDSVYQAVTSLRRLLGDDARQPSYIATVPRLGYRMVAAVGPWCDAPIESAVDHSAVSTSPSTAVNDPPAEMLSAAAAMPDPRRQSALLIGAAVALLVLVGVAWLVVNRSATDSLRGVSGTAVLDQKSIAVLPFLDLTEEMDQEYFADGITEELIDKLSKIPGLRVPAPTSSFYFKDKQVTVTEIAKALGVAYVLDGSVRKSGKMLRVAARLVRADNGFVVWSETYDRPLDDILMVQDDIADEVSKSLQASIDGATRSAATPSSAAYASYFQARAMRRDDLTKAQAQAMVDYLHKATELDPTYAAAWAELARALTYQSNYRFVPAEIIAAQARRAANQALLLGPNLSAAHLAMGMVHCYFDRDWIGAEREYQKVLMLEPGEASVLAYSADLQRALGNADAARGTMLQAIALDPLDAHYYQMLGEINYSLGNLAEAEANLRKTREVDPGVSINALLGEVQLAANNATIALQTVQQEADPVSRAHGLALVDFARGRKAESDTELATLESQAANESAWAIAQVHAYCHETDQAFLWLDRALDRHDPSCIYIKSDPLLKNLRADARFEEVLRKISLPL